MATTSVAFDAMAALVDALSARSGLSGVKVDFAAPSSDDDATEQVRLGTVVAGTQDPEVFSGGAARTARAERFDLDVEVIVRSKRTTRDAVERAFALAAEVEDEVASDPTLGGVDGLAWATVSGLESEVGQAGQLPRVVVTLTVSCRARLR
ncbi:MAG: hypothetical protein D6683_01370 [Actinomyces sp.]|nr:MAG: hypothetical protein D6683_01370 [Actinomyces sp.]